MLGVVTVTVVVLKRIAEALAVLVDFQRMLDFIFLILEE